ncbi:MAG TPA: hypothetical protein HA282_05990 [Nanoarchaeota archaeon]|nr:MAG: hypothetical protein QT01_C0001G0039 [archaeon GW2011_AR6]HIH17663.1 hypothetical protein [Nanoarchaeota archaeon]HIH34403.1 hypothetical protein [Nanoarchaeota archaeon]HIH66727.1 hypothetical protein [Nanoarchaeota archaeon]
MGGGRRKFKPRGKFVNKDRFIDASKAKESKQEQKEREEAEEKKKPSMEEFLKSLREGKG